MRVCIFGQGTGGNAALWFEYLNNINNNEIHELSYLCRTPCTLSANFNTFTPYGKGGVPKKIFKIYMGFMSRIGFKLYINILSKIKKFDVIFIQGNYNPSMNLLLMNAFDSKFVLNIYGSDYYRNYLKKEMSARELESFDEVIRRADHVVCNWYTTASEFNKSFPKFVNKTSTIPWGVNNKWFKESKIISDWPDGEKIFLSARALYDYNNIELIVEAFCKAFQSKKEFKFFIVNGYGNHKSCIENVKSIIKKYNAEDQVILKIGEWITDEELMYLYQKADYNFCFGSTDQLTVSINYALIKETINILSPLKNYYDLKARGYSSLVIADDFDVDSLSEILNDVVNLDLTTELNQDKEKSLKDFKLVNTFNKYIDIFKKLSGKND